MLKLIDVFIVFLICSFKVCVICSLLYFLGNCFVLIIFFKILLDILGWFILIIFCVKCFFLLWVSFFSNIFVFLFVFVFNNFIVFNVVVFVVVVFVNEIIFNVMVIFWYYFLELYKLFNFGFMFLL